MCHMACLRTLIMSDPASNVPQWDEFWRNWLFGQLEVGEMPPESMYHSSMLIVVDVGSYVGSYILCCRWGEHLKEEDCGGGKRHINWKPRCIKDHIYIRSEFS